MPTESDTSVASGGFYDQRLAPIGYDVAVHAIFLPFGGAGRLRNRALDLLGIVPGTRVLELGCGTGGITRRLLARGANVTAVDGSSQMLARAQRRAGGANFQHARLEAFQGAGPFDLVLFAFVLHELTPADRQAALISARTALAPGGTLSILDHAVPRTRGLARAWRTFLMRLEPPTVADCLQDGYQRDLDATDLQVVERHALARGTAQCILARPRP